VAKARSAAEVGATPTPATTNAADHRYPCFDGLRAIAALAVLLTHVAYASGAESQHVLGPFFARMDGGVAVFFVLSGFLLYLPFLRARLDDRPHPSTPSYLWRRFLRIYPAYWLAMTVVVYVFQDKAIADVRGFALWYSLLHIYDAKYAFGPLVQSWTLATEVAFYVLLPVWAALVRLLGRALGDARGVRRLRGEIVGIATLVAISVAWKAFVLSAGFSQGRIGQLKLWLPWWLDLFGFGMLLAVGAVAVRDLGRPTPLRLDGRAAPAVCWALALGAFAWVSYGAGLPHASPDIANHLLWGQHYLYGLTAVLLVLPAVFGPQTRESSRVRRFLTTRTMVYLGMISYGIYLWHEALIDRYLSLTGFHDPGRSAFSLYGSDVPFQWHTSQWISVPWFTFVLALLAATIVCATISWYALERPVLRLKDLPQRLRARGA
jgi:peptidoglycan/LPS O-acetylase OafA/YrhL